MFHQLSFFDELLNKLTFPKKSDQIFLGDVPVELQRRAYQRSLNLLVRPNGVLKVTAGRSVPTRGIQNFILKLDNLVLQDQ